MFESILCQLPPYDAAALESLIELAIEIAREGREGRRIGTLFTLGDHQKVLDHSRALILDPLALHPEAKRCLTDPSLRGTIKELAQLDGAFIVDGKGLFMAACRYLDASAVGVELTMGLGSRHVAGASITKLTDAVAVVVSESSMVRLFCHGSMVAEIIPELWLMSRQSVQLPGKVKEERFRDMAIVTKQFPVGSPKT